jgi:hypothetical protein
MKRATAITLAVAAIAVSGGCEQPSSGHVHYVFPTGFRGECRIYTNTDGESLTAQNGRWVVAIPPNGELRIRSGGPFPKWHTSSAAFTDGSAIRFATYEQGVAANAIAIRASGADSRGFHFLVVGDQSDYDEWTKRPIGR